MKSKTKLTATQIKTLKHGLQGGFLPLLGAIAPALLSALAPTALSAVGTFGDRLFKGQNLFTGQGQNGYGDVETSANSYILGSGNVAGSNGAIRRRPKKKGGANVGAGANPWIKHVKAYAKKHNLSYSEAIKKARSSYRKK